METEQISQNLVSSLNSLRQSGQGMTVSQMMSSGISFADIISMMINGTNQNAETTGIFDPQLLQNTQQTASENIIPEQFTDIFSILSPEILKGSEKNSDSWISQIFENNSLLDQKETLDLSDGLVKADPSQLAGLLDFIRTGNEIPLFTAVNESPDRTADTVSDIKSVFDPNEMIKSGEMEIVSYIPAGKTENSQTNQETPENEKEVLDFFRTMKSVKENTGAKENSADKIRSTEQKTETAETADADTVKEDSDKNIFNLESLNKYAEPVDISFERAEAELKMNRAEYELPEKQLLKGVSENLEQGKSEFTVKLKPEGLGEILVKLVSGDEGKMLLTMVASSAKTAELLNHDLSSLQSSLSQHNVEIANNSIEVAKNVMPASSAFDQYDERRQDEGNQQNQFRQIRSKVRNVSVGEVSFDSDTKPSLDKVLDQSLNILI